MSADRERWLRRARDAATEAILAGGTDDDVHAAVRAGLIEGHRVAALRRGDAPVQAAPVERVGLHPEPGSATEALLRGTGII